MNHKGSKLQSSEKIIKQCFIVTSLVFVQSIFFGGIRKSFLIYKAVKFLYEWMVLLETKTFQCEYGGAVAWIFCLV